jgi:hypothetical protein
MVAYYLPVDDDWLELEPMDGVIHEPTPPAIPVAVKPELNGVGEVAQ